MYMRWNTADYGHVIPGTTSLRDINHKSMIVDLTEGHAVNTYR